MGRAARNGNFVAACNDAGRYGAPELRAVDDLERAALAAVTAVAGRFRLQAPDANALIWAAPFSQLPLARQTMPPTPCSP
jgi:hypothetical protein